MFNWYKHNAYLTCNKHDVNYFCAIYLKLVPR